MIYREEQRTLKGVHTRSTEFTTKRQCVIFGDNLNDVENWLQSTPRKWSVKHSESNGATQSWDLGAGYRGACRLAKDGWSEGANDLDARLQAIMPASGRTARWGYSVAGSSVNIGRFLTGNPRCMRSRSRRDMGSAPVFHIVVNVVASCAVRGEQMANYGTAIVGLIDRLENTGKRVALDVMSVTKANDTRLATGWRVKAAGDHVDLGAIAFAIAHPAAFRRFGFAMMERSPNSAESHGYGRCADLIPEDVPDYTEGTMLLDGINHEPGRCNSTEDALRFAVEQLNKAAVIAGHSTIDDPLIDETELFA
jgi:hypothetical protein